MLKICFFRKNLFFTCFLSAPYVIRKFRENKTFFSLDEYYVAGLDLNEINKNE